MPQDQQPFFRQLHDTAQLNQPAIQIFSEMMRDVADRQDKDIFLMGELHGDDPILASQSFTEDGRLHATYNFNLLDWGGLDVNGLKQAITQAVTAFNGTGRLTFAFSNHDVPRSATRQLAALGKTETDQDELQLLLLQLELCLIGSTCIYQGEELALGDVQDIPVEKMQDPWGIEFAPSFLGRDTCRTPMVWQADLPNGGFSDAAETWLPVSDKHLKRGGIDQMKMSGSVYQRLAEFLAWRKTQPALMTANHMSALTGEAHEIIFDRSAAKQTLRCRFDFNNLTASFEEI